MSDISEALRKLAADHELLYNVPRREIENVLIDNRDSRISMLGRNNGLVVNEKDGTQSHIIRLGSEMAMSIGLRALADHLEKEEADAS